MAIRDILKQKSQDPITVAPNCGIDEAVATMVSNNVGCVVVADNAGSPVGILSERDILRLYNRHRAQTGKLTVTDVMTHDPRVGTLDDQEDDVLELMTQHRFRHLPIVQNGKLIGLVSLGDLVKARMAQKEEEAKNLKEYIYR